MSGIASLDNLNIRVGSTIVLPEDRAKKMIDKSLYTMAISNGGRWLVVGSYSLKKVCKRKGG